MGTVRRPRFHWLVGRRLCRSKEFALRTGFAVLILAGLNFLGVGISPPSPDWGLTINEGRETFMVAPWIGLFPALGIVLLVVSINLVTNALGELVK